MGVNEAQTHDLLSQSQWLTALAHSLVRDDLAEDVAQETMLAALQHPPTEKQPLRPWLARVARNAVRMEFRGRTRRARREEAYAELRDASAESQTAVEKLEAQKMVVDALTALDEPYRSTLIRRYFDELTSAEIAKRDGVAPATVRARIKRGIELLRNKLDAERGDWKRVLVPILPMTVPSGLASTGAAAATPVSSAAKLLPKFLLVGAAALVTAFVWVSLRSGGFKKSSGGEAAAPATAVASEEAPVAKERAGLPAAAGAAAPKAAGARGSKSAAHHPQEGACSDYERDQLGEMEFAMTTRRRLRETKPLVEECLELAFGTAQRPKGGLAIAYEVIAEPLAPPVLASVGFLEREDAIVDADLRECVRETLYSVDFDVPDPCFSSRVESEMTIVQGGQVFSRGAGASSGRASAKKRPANESSSEDRGRRAAALNDALSQAEEPAKPTEPVEPNEPTEPKPKATAAEIRAVMDTWTYETIEEPGKKPYVCDEVHCLVSPESPCCETVRRERAARVKEMVKRFGPDWASFVRKADWQRTKRRQ